MLDTASKDPGQPLEPLEPLAESSYNMYIYITVNPRVINKVPAGIEIPVQPHLQSLFRAHSPQIVQLNLRF